MQPRHIVGIIPARGGSKGVIRKNIRLLAGKPLIWYSIKGAQKSKLLERLIVSTEDCEIAEVARRCGAEVVIRPQELASDQAPTPPVLQQVLTYLEQEEGYRTDVVVLLQATTPFRKAEDIDKAIQLLLDTGADSVVSVIEAPHTCNPHWVRKIVDGRLCPYLDDDKLYTQRQALPKVYWRNGQIYALKRETLFNTGDLYGEDCRPYLMSSEYHVNIDGEIDFRVAEVLIQEGKVRADQ